MKLITTLACLISILCASSSLAELVDPTAPIVAGPQKISNEISSTSFRLEAIVSSDNNRFAVINGQRYRQGENLGELTLWEINRTDIVLQQRQQQYVLSLGASINLQGHGNE